MPTRKKKSAKKTAAKANRRPTSKAARTATKKKKTPNKTAPPKKPRRPKSPNTAALKQKNPGGRPPGRRNKARAEVVGESVFCPRCHSTERTKYEGTPTEQAFGGHKCDRCPRTGPKGDACPCGGRFEYEFTHIVKRRSQCAHCTDPPQFLIVRTYENRKPSRRRRRAAA